MDKILKKAAEILVECGYADAINDKRPMTVRRNLPIGEDYYPLQVECDPFADTLEGRRQADAISSFLWSSGGDLDHLWEASECQDSNPDHFQHRIARVKWCLEQLGE